jgi:hypothetical protein
MYSATIVIPAVEAALSRRGFAFPKPGSGIGKDAVAARRLAYDALHSLTNGTPSGISKLIGCTATTALVMQQAAAGFYRSPEERQAWLDEVRGLVERSAQGLQSAPDQG